MIVVFFLKKYFGTKCNYLFQIKTVLEELQHCFNCLPHIWCQIFVVQCEYSSTRDQAPEGRPLRLDTIRKL